MYFKYKKWSNLLQKNGGGERKENTTLGTGDMAQ